MRDQAARRIGHRLRVGLQRVQCQASVQRKNRLCVHSASKASERTVYISHVAAIASVEASAVLIGAIINVPACADPDAGWLCFFA